jgi:hypothetical protein
MIINRQNILDLIGKNSSKYTSCLITCYSFDFPFFEEKVMSVLRTSNVKNINVFLDGKYLENHLEEISGTVFQNKIYSLNPIYKTGVFHPKIMLLTGKKNGLLIIGSGNLTNSGLSSNDEIWGAFHLNSVDSQNSALFAQVWEYLQQFIVEAKGFNAQKLNWISQYSPWLNDLKKENRLEFSSIKNHLDINFLANTVESSLYMQLHSLLPSEKVKKLTIISPYFDEKALFLENICSDFQIEKINCITDNVYGILPIGLSDKLYNKIKFYNWDSCQKDFDSKFNRLHAKLFHFEFENGWEYLLLGSANASINAFGSKTISPKNAEACILIRREMKHGFIKELGIEIKANSTFDIKDFKKRVKAPDESTAIGKYLNRIVYAEYLSNKINLYLAKGLTANSELIILNAENDILDSIFIESSKTEYSLSHITQDLPIKLYLVSVGIQISNYCLIHDIARQSKCNPDSTHEKLTAVIDSILSNPDNTNIVQLLDYIDFNLSDEENSTKIQTPKLKSVGSQINTKNNSDEKSISSDEFNKLQSKQSITHIYNNTNTQIADLLSILSKGLIISQVNIEESEEESIVNQTEPETGLGNSTEHERISQPDAAKDKAAIVKYLSIVNGHFYGKIKGLVVDGKATSFNALTINDMSCLSVALDIMIIFYGKTYTYKVVNTEIIKVEKFSEEFDSYVFEILSYFALSAVKGYKKYDSESANDKIIALRINVFEKATFLCMNQWWNETKHLRNTLLLDILHFVYPYEVSNEGVNNIKESLSKLYVESKYKNLFFNSNFKDYVDVLLTPYISWSRHLETNKELLFKPVIYSLTNCIVYNSKFGFSYLHDFNEDMILFEKAGFEWDAVLHKYIYTHKPKTSKIIGF